jgi:glycosyltransferase involved in cell wall biosynthesis
MSAQAGRLRIVGVAAPDVSDWSDPIPAGKWSQFFAALARRVTLVDTIRPALPPLVEWLNLVRNFRPHRERWRARAGFDVAHTARVTATVERELQKRRGSYDLIVQLQTIFAPGSSATTGPFVVYTDNTFALTQRVYPAWAPLPPSRVEQWLEFESGVCRAAQTVFTFSEFARTSMIDDYGCDPESVVTVGAGANQLLETVEEKDYSLPRALFVGRPFELKGGPTLLKAWSLVRQQIPDAELTIAGPPGEPPRGLGPGVSWLGRVDRQQLARLYRESTLFVLPSMFDAWGHVFVEAMAHGLPCIGTTCCAMPEIIEDGRTGHLVPRDEPEPLAEAIIDLLSDPGVSEQMGRRAHARILRELTWDHVVDRVVRRLPVGEVAGS